MDEQTDQQSGPDVAYAYENEAVVLGPITVTVDQIENHNQEGVTRKRVRLLVTHTPADVDDDPVGDPHDSV